MQDAVFLFRLFARVSQDVVQVVNTLLESEVFSRNTTNSTSTSSSSTQSLALVNLLLPSMETAADILLREFVCGQDPTYIASKIVSIGTGKGTGGGVSVRKSGMLTCAYV